MGRDEGLAGRGENVVLGECLCLPRFGETGRVAGWVGDSSLRGSSGIRRPLKLGGDTRALSGTTWNSARTQEVCRTE